MTSILMINTCHCFAFVVKSDGSKDMVYGTYTKFNFFTIEYQSNIIKSTNAFNVFL